MSDDGALRDMGRYEWERIVRRVRLNPSAKLVAFACASYASADGSSIYPGAVKLAAVTGLTERTVRTALQTLRDLGLLYRTREGRRAGRAALADEHKLTRPVDLLDRVHLLGPEESPETISCDATCTHKGSPALSSGDRAGTPETTSGDDVLYTVEHRNSATGTPEMSSGTPEMSDTNTGNEFPPPLQDHAKYQPKDQREDHLGNGSTEGMDLEELHAQLIEIDRQAEARRVR